MSELPSLCPGCGHRSPRAPGVACADCGLPHRMHRWVDSIEDDASGAVGASLVSAGLVGAAVIATTLGHGLGGDAVVVTWLTSPLLVLGGWGVRELVALRHRQAGRAFRCLEQSDPRGDFRWVEATVQLDASGRIRQGKGRSRRVFRQWPDDGDDARPAADEAAALWLIASFAGQDYLQIELTQEWSWSCAEHDDQPSMENPYRGEPGAPVWSHQGGHPRVHVTRTDGLDALISGDTLTVIQGSVSSLPAWGPGPIELGALVDRMLTSDSGPLVAMLTRVREHLAREPDSRQTMVRRLARRLGR